MTYVAKSRHEASGWLTRQTTYTPVFVQYLPVVFHRDTIVMQEGLCVAL